MSRYSEIAELNFKKYAQPPSWDQIETLVKEMNLSYLAFEKFYGITPRYLSQIKLGVKRLPPQHWHIIYERIKPKYGVGFIGDYAAKVHKNRIKHPVAGINPEHFTTKGHFHGRLTTISKHQQNKPLQTV